MQQVYYKNSRDYRMNWSADESKLIYTYISKAFRDLKLKKAIHDIHFVGINK